MSLSQRILVLAGVGIVAALAGVLLARGIAERAPPTLQSGTLIEPPKTIPPFALLDQDGAPFTPERLQSRWSLLFFGFTNCGDICPTTLALMAGAAKSLTELRDSDKPQLVFVSVDAQRDTPAIVKTYVRNFDPAFVGVTGAQHDLQAFARSLGVPSAIRPLPTGYAVDHSGSILVIDPHGGFRALFSPPHSMAALANDYRHLIGK